jgi:hypothetical protein
MRWTGHCWYNRTYFYKSFIRKVQGNILLNYMCIVLFRSKDVYRSQLSQGMGTGIKWRQHIARMEENTIPKATINYKLMARRLQGRRRKSCLYKNKTYVTYMNGRLKAVCKSRTGLHLGKLPMLRRTLFVRRCNFKRWVSAANSQAGQA